MVEVLSDGYLTVTVTVTVTVCHSAGKVKDFNIFCNIGGK